MKRSKFKIGALIVLCLAIQFIVGCSGDILSKTTYANKPSSPAEVSTAPPAEPSPSTEVSTIPSVDPSTGSPENSVTTPKATVTNGSDMALVRDIKAIWISQFDLANVYINDGRQCSQSSYTRLIRNILTKTKSSGFNTVIVQMRPYGDSMYPSDYYPASACVTGSYGTDVSYDPMEILIREAHELSLSVHAWINPMRCMKDSEIGSVSSNYLIRQWYEDLQMNGTRLVLSGGRYYLNPAYDEVRSLIVDGAREILTRYDVDGLHMDDYFYPSTDASFDEIAYRSYKEAGGKLPLSDFRRQCMNKLVSQLYQTVKTIDKGLVFGISPSGNMETVYTKEYADIYTWCAKEGYIDYICPQVYFGMEHQSYDFIKVCLQWQNILKNENVELIIGLTLGKAQSGVDQYAGSGKYEWTNNKDILLRCLEYTKELKRCSGVAYFSYQYFYNPVTGVSVSETQQERDNFIPLLQTIHWN